MKRKIHLVEDAFAVILVIALTLTSLVFKVMQDNFHLQILNADNLLINLAFVFSCVAGLITWREERHLSLASVSSKLPAKVKTVIDFITNVVIAMVLVQVFMASFCQLVNPDQFALIIWGIPERVYFFFFPFCYFLILILVCLNKKYRVASIIGIIIGLITSVGSFSGVLYYITGAENLNLLYTLSDTWNLLCAKMVWPFIIILIIMAFTGAPLFVVITGITYVAFSLSGGYVDVIPLEAYSKLSDKSIAAIPMFTIAGYVLAQGSAGRRFVDLFNSLFGWFRGGTVVAAVVVMTFFSTFTGVSGVTILALGSLLTLILTGSGFRKDKAEALITSSGALGLLFPPSIAIIMYATSNYTVISQFESGFDVIHLFIGALLPGIIMALAMITIGIVYDKKRERPKFSIKKILNSLYHCVWELLLPVFICVFYFMGWFNLFEVASFAVVYVFVLGTFIRRDFSIYRKNPTKKSVARVIADSVPVSGGVLFIIAAAAGLSYFMQDANIPEIVTEFITTYVKNKYLFLLLMNVVLLIVGCLMDIYSAILLVSPLFLYSSQALGIPIVQAGVIFLMNLSIGFLTPPVGMDLFISSYTFKKPVSEVIKGVVPFLIVQLVVLMLVTYVPWFTCALLPK